MLTGSRFLTPWLRACVYGSALPMGCWMLSAAAPAMRGPDYAHASSRWLANLSDLTSDALLWTAGCAIVAAPLYGVVAAKQRSFNPRLLGPAGSYVAISAVLVAAVNGTWE